MALPAFRAAGAGATAAAAATSVDVPYPAGLVADDYLVLQITKSSATATVTTPSGWTLLFGPDQDPTATRQWVFAKYATGSESGDLTVTVNTSGNDFARMYAYSGVLVDADPLDAIGGAALATYATSTSHTMPSVTTTGADRMALAACGFSGNATVTAPSTETGGDWTEAVAEYSTSSNSGGCLSLLQAEMAAAGTISGGAVALNNTRRAVIRGFALLPTAPAVSPRGRPPTLVGLPPSLVPHLHGV